MAHFAIRGVPGLFAPGAGRKPLAGRLASGGFFVAASRFQPLVLIGLGVIRLLRAMKNLSGISGVIRLNEQIRRPQATRNRRKHRPSISIRSRFIHAKETSELNPVFYWNL